MKKLATIALMALFTTPVLAESTKIMNNERMRQNNSYPDTTGSTPGMLNQPNSEDENKGDQSNVPSYQRGNDDAGGPAKELNRGR
jgi:uncharacterized protein YdeI (BOF family)